MHQARPRTSWTTIYHELGHIYYYLAYNEQPPLFQNGAHDGFHEAIGDTIVLSMTPDYLNSIGLVDKPTVSHEAVINAQMRMALAKVAFLPFGLMIDRWRWGVFDGSIKPEQLQHRLVGPEGEVPGRGAGRPRAATSSSTRARSTTCRATRRTRATSCRTSCSSSSYKSLCDASGFKGPLHELQLRQQPGSRQALLGDAGARAPSQPWPATLKELTGGETDGRRAVLEYFAPLQTWLQEQNKGQTCTWKAG